MSSPLFWSPKLPLQPIGNVAAISLTQDLAPEQSADILLLGCGDPRHILFTLFADVSTASGPRKLDIICCDLEPAVLARNILLFTLLDDKEATDQVWDIFYHFKIGDQASDIITRQSQKLCDNSQSIETWRQSPYGSFVKFADTRTLAELRSYWKNYADFPRIPSDRLNRLRKEQVKLSQSALGESNHNKSASYATGMLWMQAATPLNNLFKRYWETGTLCEKDEDVNTSTNLNPTFIYSTSGEVFDLHPGTFPQGFHLTPAMTPICSDTPNIAALGTESAFVDTMKQQFRAWADAFHTSRAADAIVLRFFSGDALALCRALDLYATTRKPSTGTFASPWRAAQIKFDELHASTPPAPISFDVIDTSDLSDYFGLFNILLATRHLMKESATSQSVIYTETTLSAGKEPIRPFMDRVYTTIPTFSALFGIAPRAYVSGFTTHFNIHEVLSPQHINQYHERVVWTDPASGDRYAKQQQRVSFDAKELSRTVFAMYSKMFAPEQVMVSMIGGGRIKTPIPLHYHRETVAMLWKFIKRRVDISTGYWEMTMDNFYGHYEDAQFPLSAGVYTEDLWVQLHIHSVHTIAPLKPDWRVGWAASNSSGVFRDWPDVPSVLCVVFTVPRRSLRVLLDNKDTTGVPNLECRVGYPREGHTFSTIHAIWGKCVTAEGSNKATLEEDPEGINGKSDLIIMFWATSRLLEFPDISVVLRLKKTLHSMQEFTQKLGPNFELFSAKIHDKNHVRFMPYRPSLASEDPLPLEAILTPIPDPWSTVNNSVAMVATIDSAPSKRHVISFTAHVDIDIPAEQEALANGAEVIAAQISPCVMKLSIGDHDHIVPYPYPILGSKRELRVARKSKYVEIVVPFSQPLDSSGYSLDPAPIALKNAYSSWNMHHISVDRMPQIDLEDPNKIDWLYSHTMLQLSDREHEILQNNSASKTTPAEALANVKESIRTLVMRCSGFQGAKTRAISLCESDSSSPYATLLLGGLRLDLASFTIIVDAALVPISKEQTPTQSSSIQKLQDEGLVTQVVTGELEAFAWKKLLTGFVERCRTWSHTPNCEYASQDRTSSLGQNLICTCGHGVGFEGPEWKVAAWQELLPFATRIAISPLFGVSYIEYGPGTAMMFNTRQPMPAGSGVRSQTKRESACWICGGAGNPTLAACARCKKAKYCSAFCQGMDWKTHKKSCRKS